MFCPIDVIAIVYEYFASSWVFNPEHFKARLQDDKYRTRLEDRSAAWASFVLEWIPKQFPNYRKAEQDLSLDEWRKQMRVIMREKVFTMFPEVTLEYYTKRGAHLKEVEEHRLQHLLMKSIPAGEEVWSEDIPKPQVLIIHNPAPATDMTNAGQVVLGDNQLSTNQTATEQPPTPPTTPPSSITSAHIGLNHSHRDPLSTPLHLEALSRTPGRPFEARPPPQTMSIEAKLLCMARWTHFDPQTGAPYIGCEPREKKFEMCWSDSGASDDVLTKWVSEMWWGIWVRQAWVNYVGMWKKRLEKEDAKAEKAKLKAKEEKDKAEEEHMKMQAEEEKIVARLRVLNGGL